MKTTAEFTNKIKELIEDVSLGAHSAASIPDSARIIADLNLDSLDYATVLLGCETWAGMKVREDGIRWSEVDTIEKLANLFASQQQG